MGTFAKYDPVELDILKCWEESRNEDEAFEDFDSNMVDPDLIEKVLGKSVLNDYMTWIYLTIK